MNFAQKFPDSKALKPNRHTIPADRMPPAHLLHFECIQHIHSTYRRGTLNLSRFRGAITGDGTAYLSLPFKKPHVINATVHFGLTDSVSNLAFLHDLRDFAQAGMVTPKQNRWDWIVHVKMFNVWSI